MATDFTNASPDGLHHFHSAAAGDLTTLVVLWAWSASSQAWLRQTDAEPALEVLTYLQALLADCPTVRAALTPCVPV
jgi:hypothetical protein